MVRGQARLSRRRRHQTESLILRLKGFQGGTVETWKISQVGKVGSPRCLLGDWLYPMKALEDIARGKAQNNRAAVGAGSWRRGF